LQFLSLDLEGFVIMLMDQLHGLASIALATLD